MSKLLKIPYMMIVEPFSKIKKMSRRSLSIVIQIINQSIITEMVNNIFKLKPATFTIEYNFFKSYLDRCHEYMTTVDHKKLRKMYLVFSV